MNNDDLVNTVGSNAFRNERARTLDTPHSLALDRARREKFDANDDDGEQHRALVRDGRRVTRSARTRAKEWSSKNATSRR